MKITVRPLVTTFPVKDAEGRAIPKGGAQVEDTPVVRRRIHEGLLEIVGADPAAKPTAPVRKDPGPATDEVEVDKLTVAELRAVLEDAKVEIPEGAKKPELIDLVLRHLDGGEGE